MLFYSSASQDTGTSESIPSGVTCLIWLSVQEAKAAAEQKSSSTAEDKEVLGDAKKASKQAPASKKAKAEGGDGDSDSDLEIVEEEQPEKGSHSGFYRATRETGRANVLLALQVCQQHVHADSFCQIELRRHLARAPAGCSCRSTQQIRRAGTGRMVVKAAFS